MKCEVGKIVGLLGRNGSGKSTLMKIVFGSMDSDFKSVRINKSPLTGKYLKHRRIGYLPQTDWLPPHLKVKQALNHFNLSACNIMNDFPSFSDWMDFPVQKLSGGYKRILEVYLILSSVHEFVLLDEPFSGLMPIHIEDMKRIINKVKAAKGIIISDHLYRHILEIVDETYLLSNNKTHLIKNKEELVFRGYLAEA
jgi:ABC-type multidrug transport system ATPase subunit